MFVGHLYIFFGEMSIQVLCPHFHGVVCLFVTEMCSLDTLDIRPFSDIRLANILFSQFELFSPFCVRKLDFEIYYFSSTTFLESWHRGQDLIPKFSCQWPSFILPLVLPPGHVSTPSVEKTERNLSCEGGHENPLQYSCPENPMDRGAWWAIPWGH